MRKRRFNGRCIPKTEADLWLKKRRKAAIVPRQRNRELHYVAALCLQHEVRALRSADRDYSRFAGLAVTNLLAR